MEQSHLLPKGLDLFVGQNLRQEIVKGLLPIKHHPLVLVAVGENLIILEEHRREERRIASASKPMNPLVNAVVILAEVDVGSVARPLRHYRVPIVENEQVH